MATSGAVVTRCRPTASSRERSTSTRPKASCVEIGFARPHPGRLRHGEAERRLRGIVRARCSRRTLRPDPRGRWWGRTDPTRSSVVEADRRAEVCDLLAREQRRVVARVARERQPPALHGVGEDDARPISHGVARGVGIEERTEVVTAEIVGPEARARRRRPLRRTRRRTSGAPSRNRLRRSSPATPKQAWYCSLGIASIQSRSASPPGRPNASVSRRPYFTSTTCQPAAANCPRHCWIRTPGTTRSRLCRLKSTIQVTLPRPSVAGSAIASQMLPSSSSASPISA